MLNWKQKQLPSTIRHYRIRKKLLLSDASVKTWPGTRKQKLFHLQKVAIENENSIAGRQLLNLSAGIFILQVKKMKRYLQIFITILVITVISPATHGQLPVEKTNPMKVYMHYMPWFETPETIGRWGWHWTMNTMDPNRVIDGQRQIASHYYPLIGPYASRNKEVIEYHLLLIKLAGIDGILIDWYGTVGSNGDVKDLLKSSDSIVARTGEFGLEFGVVLEDRFSRSKDDVKANFAYLKNNYFNRSEYIRMGEDKNPLVCIFGPICFEDPADWTEILPAAGEEIEFLPLWYESSDAGASADGEYSWIFQDETGHLDHLTNFYSNRAPSLKIAMGSAYPGFNDFYAEGGAGSGYFTIPHYYGSTLTETFNKAEQYKEHIDLLQLATFNDFGEGTMFEPTVETGFDYLKRVQAYTGVAYGENELKLVYKLFQHRKGYAGNPAVQDSLDDASNYLRNLEIDSAAMILNEIEVIPVIIGVDDQVKAGTNGVRVFPNPHQGGPLTIELNSEYDGISGITILDMKGRKVAEKLTGITREALVLDNLALIPGVYLLLTHGNSFIYSSKLTVTGN